VLGNIAFYVAREDLLRVRLTSPNIARKTFHAFAEQFLANGDWHLTKLLGAKHYWLQIDRQHDKIAGLVYVPEFADRVNRLELKFANKFEVSWRAEALAMDANLLKNLQPLSFDGGFKHCTNGDFFTTSIFNFSSQLGHNEIFNQLQFPLLDHFAIRNSDVSSSTAFST
jgi:hypothetical protein